MNDLVVFSNPNFDPNEYANTILASDMKSGSKALNAMGKSSLQDSIAKEDVSIAMSKLNFAIDDVTKQIKNVVTVHHEALLVQAANANEVSGSLTSIRSGVDDLNASVAKLRAKVHTPHEALQVHLSVLQKFQQASDLLRRTSRFVVLARRLRVHIQEMEGAGSSDIQTSKSANDGESKGMSGSGQVIDTEDEKERTLAKAALSIAELAALLDGSDEEQEFSDVVDQQTSYSKNRCNTLHPNSRISISLRSIRAVVAYESLIEDSRSKVTREMESMILTGLSTLNQTLLASALQAAYNLNVLPTLVQNLLFDLSRAVEDRIRNAFDPSKISKDVLGKDTDSVVSPTIYKSRIRTEPTNITAPQWTSAFWARLEVMFEEMKVCCIKVYTLEKVLKMKKDTANQASFLDEAMKVLENKPTSTFWASLCISLEKYSKDSIKSSAFLHQTLGAGYPRLLRLFHAFFEKIAVHTDTIYIGSFQSPETILVLRTLHNIEALYLMRSAQKLSETVGNIFAAGSRGCPGFNDGVTIGRAISNELDSARFDPLLVKSVTKNVASCLDMVLSRIDAIVVRDRSAVSLLGPTATPQQANNAQLTSCLYGCWLRLIKLETEYSSVVFSNIFPSLEIVRQAYEQLLDPLTTAIRRELAAIISKIHRIDYSKTSDPMSGMGGASFYAKEVTEKLSFIKNEILSKYTLGDASQAWVVSLVRFCIKMFLLHASIARPLGESGKLQMTNDMTEIEFALNAFVANNTQGKRGGNLDVVGDEYHALRALRRLFFLDRDQLRLPQHTTGLPPLIVLHHILVRSRIPLPHVLHGWQEAEYVRWVDEHSEGEGWTLVEGVLSHWEKEDGDEVEDKFYLELARSVLANARNII